MENKRTITIPDEGVVRPESRVEATCELKFLKDPSSSSSNARLVIKKGDLGTIADVRKMTRETIYSICWDVWPLVRYNVTEDLIRKVKSE